MKRCRRAHKKPAAYPSRGTRTNGDSSAKRAIPLVSYRRAAQKASCQSVPFPPNPTHAVAPPVRGMGLCGPVSIVAGMVNVPSTRATCGTVRLSRHGERTQ